MQYIKIIYLCACILLITGCANSKVSQESNYEEYQEVINKIHRIIPSDKDILLFVNLEFGWPRHNANIEKMKFVKDGSIHVCTGDRALAYSSHWECQDGLGYVDFLGDSLYSAKMSLKGMDRLYRPPSNSSTFGNAIWLDYREQLLDLAKASDEYIAMYKKEISARGLSFNDNAVDISFPESNQISFSWLTEKVRERSETAFIKQQVDIYIAKQESLKQKDEAMRLARLEAYKKADLKRQARIIAEKAEKLEDEQQYKQAMVIAKKTWSNRFTASLEPGFKVCTLDNRMGFVERVEGSKVKVLVKGKLLPKFSERYFFGGETFDEFNSKRFLIEEIDSISWFDKGDIATCGFELDA